MNLSGERLIAADVSVVWAGLLSADILKECVPGCTEMSGSASEGFEATVVQKVGPVKATFKGAVTLVVHLEKDSDSTLLRYDVEAKVGGKLAQLGSRIIDGFAKKMADQFFENFQNAVEPPAEDDGDGDAEADAKKKGWFSKLRG